MPWTPRKRQDRLPRQEVVPLDSGNEETQAVEFNPQSNWKEIPYGTLAGDYEVGSRIAHGGCGVVFHGRNRKTGQRVAIKVLKADVADSPSILERFAREARLASTIKHPHIVEVLDIGSLSDGRPYYAMEYLDGMSLAQSIRAQGRFSPSEALAVLEPVALALEAAHKAGIVHRDVKAANIMLMGPRERPSVKLVDFGIGKLIHPDPNMPSLTVKGFAVGTPSTMAPEQVRGEAVDGRTDIYALGVVLYHLLTGELPFAGETSEQMARSHLMAPAPPPSRIVPISPGIDAVVLRCMEKEPARRFATPSDFASALRNAVSDSTGAKAAFTDSDSLGIYVGASYDMGSDEDVLLKAMDDVAKVLDASAKLLTSAGYSLNLQTGSSQLGVAPLPDSPQQQLQARRKAVGLASKLHADLVRELGTSPVSVEVCLHVAKARVREGPSGHELIGGPLAQVDDWTPQPGTKSAMTTRAAAQELLATPEGPLHFSIPPDFQAEG
jgi:serine/threonine-protein kinase